MHISKIKRSSFPLFSDISNAFLYHPKQFDALAHTATDADDFSVQLSERQSFSSDTRKIITEVLREQYANVEHNELALEQIEKLQQENCFTVVTGHQLSLFGGPLFFIYKILHTIRLCEDLNKKYPGKHIVPVFWMASEDHDFDEINHFHLFNQRLSWEKHQGGAVGKYTLDDWDTLTNTVKGFFQNYPDAEVHALIDSYKGKNLADACFRFVHKLFNAYGLVIINADDARLKKLILPVFEREIKFSFAEKPVLEANEKLEKLAYKPQVHVRPVNIFYLGENTRERIIPVDEGFEIKGLGTLKQDELLRLLYDEPEAFSPNVVLRPVYQETVLPNLAYIGGGGEIAYWLQLKGVFDVIQVPFPKLQIRNSIQLFDSGSRKRAEKLGFDVKSFFESLESLKKDYLNRNLSNPINFSVLEAQADELKQTLESLILSADVNLKNFAEAEKTKLSNQLENVKHKLQKIEKTRFEQALKQIEDLRNKLFPENGLQERHDNFLNFCPDGNYSQFIADLKSAIDPFEKDLLLIEITD